MMSVLSSKEAWLLGFVYLRLYFVVLKLCLCSAFGYIFKVWLGQKPQLLSENLYSQNNIAFVYLLLSTRILKITIDESRGLSTFREDTIAQNVNGD